VHLGPPVLAPFRINHPLRVAERAAMLDVISEGRLELGLARSGGNEWDTFHVEPSTTREELVEAMRMIPKMWTQDSFEWDSALLHFRGGTDPAAASRTQFWQTWQPESFHLGGGSASARSATLLPASQIRCFWQYRRGLASCTEPAGKFNARPPSSPSCT
jgi:alkanesulfonate monooxygenase SsuD/methylene tetrahydromethanopterin reductase-like flavin-dependent oxidoreductase (luciferase family)